MTKPGGLLQLTPAGDLTAETKRRLDIAWDSFCKMPEPDTRDRNHRKVWQYLVDDFGKSRRVDDAYDLYKTQLGSKAMSRETFKRYAETVPAGTKNWIWRMNQPYNDIEVQAHTNWLRDADDTPSHWANELEIYLDKGRTDDSFPVGESRIQLSPAEQNSVEAFYNGENVYASTHPSRKSFARARGKLKELLVEDGYLADPRPRLRSSVEGTGRSFTVQTGRIAKGLPRA